MRNLKKFLALVLAMLMVFSMAVITTSAADDADYSDAAHHLAALKILKGDENGNLNLDNGVTRWQAALFFVQALTGKTDAKIWNADKSVYFSDVPEYGTAIDYAYGMSLIVGRGNGVYGYADAITYQDMLVMAVRALGYETDNMVYPSGYILAAQKLGLTENIAVDVNYKAALTRGETAQIIWDMLGTEVAYVDPLSGDVVYPDQTSSLELILNAGKDEADWVTIERTTLLEESGFADAELVGIVAEYIVADEDENDYEEDMVVVDVDGTDYIVKAADLGITAETKPSTYLGLPVTLFIDCAADDFAEKYADEEASVVFASYESYTVVENLADAGNIKIVINEKNDDKTYLSLGGTKFTNGKYDFVLKTWDDEFGWTDDDAAFDAFNDSFVYDDEYVGEGNTYGKVAYRVTEDALVEILYTPYEFGQYNVLTLKDAATSKDADFATYTDGFATTMRLFGSDKIVSEKTTSVSKTNGALAKAVTVEGEEVESGDFMFYAYNAADNVLTVAQNCGTYETGRLTGASTSKDTVKIDGSSKSFGFKGLFTANGQTAYFDGIAGPYVEALEKGKDNVKFLAVDNRIVWLGEPDEETEATAGAYEFAVVSTDVAIMVDLLGLEDGDDYTNALTDGLYIDENGNIAIAVLDLTTGEWKLGSLSTLSVAYDIETEKFATPVDLATYAEFQEMGMLSEDAEAKYDAAYAALDNSILAVLSEKDGVYTMGYNTGFGIEAPAEVAKPDGYDALTPDEVAASPDEAVKAYTKYLADVAAYTAATDVYAPFAVAPNTDGIVFNAQGRTNPLKVPGTYDEETNAYDTVRVTPAAGTVIVLVGEDGAVGVRVGATKYSSTFNYDIAAGANVMFAVSSDLIVIEHSMAAQAAIALDLDMWSNSSSVASSFYYVATPATDIEIDTNEDGETVYTVTNLFQMNTGKMVDSIETTVDVSDLSVGETLYQHKNGKLMYKDYNLNSYLYMSDKVSGTEIRAESIQRLWQFTKSNTNALTRKEATNLTPGTFKWIDDESVAFGSWKASFATKVTGHGMVLNLTTVDQEEYDFTRMILANADGTPFVVSFETGAENTLYNKYLAYAEDGAEFIDAGSEGDVDYYYVSFPVEEDGYHSYGAPTVGVWNNYIADHAATKLLVPTMDADDGDYEDAVVVKMHSGITSAGKTDAANRMALTLGTTTIIADDVYTYAK